MYVWVNYHNTNIRQPPKEANKRTKNENDTNHEQLWI